MKRISIYSSTILTAIVVACLIAFNFRIATLTDRHERVVEAVAHLKVDLDNVVADLQESETKTRHIVDSQLQVFLDRQRQQRASELLSSYDLAPADLELEQTQLPVFGAMDSEYMLIEFADLECPYCKRQHPESKKFISKYSEDVSLQYRHFPLRQLHPGAIDKHRQAVCVSQQSNQGFWLALDQLYANAMSGQDVVRELGLDLGSYQHCMNGDTTNDTLVADNTMAKELGINSTPVLYLLHKSSGQSLKLSGFSHASTIEAAYLQLLNTVSLASR